MKILYKIHQFIKKETIFTIGTALAILSMLLVHPDHQYINYIDWSTILLLFCLMAVMAGFKQLGVFRAIGIRLLSHTGHT
ncbi:MAG: citrate transporter, partial [Wujia sp.]